MKYGCIGEKLGHSFSKDIHSRFAPYEYELLELKPDEVGAFLEKKDFAGINVTIPYKETVIPYLDEISDEARQIGAVNTIVNRGGRLCGFNTDFFGMRCLLRKNGFSLKEKKVLILGTGGTSKTARALAFAEGARDVLRVSRTAREGAVSYEKAYSEHADADFLINTTPCGMFPNAGISPVDLEGFPRLSGVLDAIYNPLKTRLFQEARKRGVPAACGLYMLVAQAVRAAEIFLDRPFPEEVIARVTEEIRKEKQNLVLIGMPASGKSTLGKLAAERLGRPFFDSDEEIVKEAGKTIPEIFRDEGEKGFRDREEKMIRALSARQGIVLATGGGAVLREENRRCLSSNGKIIFLLRPLSFLEATSDRPLSSNRSDLERRFRERDGVYRAFADCIFPAGEDKNKNADAIVKEFLK